MKVTVDSRGPSDVTSDLLAVPVTREDVSKSRLAPRLSAIDRTTGGAVRAAIASGDFTGKPGESATLYPRGSSKVKRVVLLGLGAAKNVDADALRRVAGRAVSLARTCRSARVSLAVPSAGAGADPDGAQALAEGALLAAYRFDGYRKARREDTAVRSIGLLVPRGADLRATRAAARIGVTIAEGQNTARDLSNEPPNELPPAALARRAQAVGKQSGCRVRVLAVPELEKLKMGAILAVGGGSVHPPRLVVMEHRPKRVAKGVRPVCIVGKGITFDSGGISIKPSAAMDEMKHDMSGAATVVGLLQACAELDLPVPVVGVIGAAENLPSGTAYRPGDIVRAASGKTIEVLNTDAEGRVVLADALHYARTEFDPCAIIDLATLTGACVVALGKWATGLFGNHPGLIELVRAAGDRVSERAWPMPLLDGHRDEIRSPIADIKNTGGRNAGSSTAAAFLEHFVDDTPWVHLDIAGTGWTTSKDGPYQPRGATGVGVRLLVELLRTWDPSDLD